MKIVEQLNHVWKWLNYQWHYLNLRFRAGFYPEDAKTLAKNKVYNN